MVKRKSVRIVHFRLRVAVLAGILFLYGLFAAYYGFTHPETRRRWPFAVSSAVMSMFIMAMSALMASHKWSFIRGTVDELVVYQRGSMFRPLRIRKDLQDLALEVSIPASRDLVRLPAAQRNAATATFLVHKGRRKIAVVALAPQAPNRDAAERFEYWQRSVLGSGDG